MSKTRIKYLKHKLLIIFIQVLIVISFFIIWQFLTDTKVINSFLFSSPIKMGSALLDLLKDNNFWPHIFTTLYEVSIAFIFGITIGFFIAIMLYELPFLAEIFDPFLTMLNSLPKVALGPLIIIIAGANTKSIIMMALLINLIVNIITIYNGFLNTDKSKIKLFDSLKATKIQKLIYLVIPGSFNTIISSLKLNISMSLIGVIMGEFLVSKKGIGYLIIYGTQIFNLDLVMLGILVLAIISFILYEMVYYLEKKLLK